MNKKILISVTGIAAFLIAGALTMFLKPVEKFNQPEHKEKIQTQPEVKPEIKIQEDWYVYVTGEVKNPGVYKVSPDSRFFHAVEAAGGFTSRADQNSINMAERLIDGFQIYVAAKNELENISSPAPQPQQNNFTKIPGVPNNRSNIVAQNQNYSVLIDINNASAKELQQLKGVGPAIAKRIVDYRKSHGRFSSPEDLLNVRGIGEKTLEKMRSQILIR